MNNSLVELSPMKISDMFQPWKEFVSRPTNQENFYFVAPELHSNVNDKTSCYYLHPGSEIEQVVAYTNPISSIICRAVFDCWKENDCVWLVSGKAVNDCRSIEGKVGLDKAKILKKTTFKLTMTDTFKVVGG